MGQNWNTFVPNRHTSPRHNGPLHTDFRHAPDCYHVPKKKKKYSSGSKSRRTFRQQKLLQIAKENSSAAPLEQSTPSEKSNFDTVLPELRTAVDRATAKSSASDSASNEQSLATEADLDEGGQEPEDFQESSRNKETKIRPTKESVENKEPSGKKPRKFPLLSAHGDVTSKQTEVNEGATTENLDENKPENTGLSSVRKGTTMQNTFVK